MTIREALQWGIGQLKNSGVDSPILDAEVLLTHALQGKPSIPRNRGITRAWIYAHPEKVMSVREIRRYKRVIALRLRREPVAYIFGRKEFYGLEFAVKRGVLIPRPETEVLVEEAVQEIERCQDLGFRCQVVDVGVGSGAIIISIAKTCNLKPIIYFATDISPAALRMARKNARRHGVADRITFLRGNLLVPLLRSTSYLLRTQHLIVTANLPYLSTSEWRSTAPEIREWEPRKALDGGRDGLKYYRELFRQLKHFVVPAPDAACGQAPAGIHNKSKIVDPRSRSGMTVLAEICPEQTEAFQKMVRKFFSKARFRVKKDLSGRARVMETRICRR